MIMATTRTLGYKCLQMVNLYRSRVIPWRTLGSRPGPSLELRRPLSLERVLWNKEEPGPKEISPMPRPLLDCLTPEFSLALTGKITSKRFRLRAIQSELEMLYQEKFPLPETLTEEQWKHLMSFNVVDSRIYYLDSISQGVDSLDELKAKDAEMIGPLVVPKDLLEDSTNREIVKQIQLDHEKMRQLGEIIPTVLSDEQWNQLITTSSSRQRAQAMRYFAAKKKHKLKALVDKRASASLSVENIMQERKKREEEKHIVYGLGYNSIFLRFYDKNFDRFENEKSIRQFHEWGHPLVIDMAFVNMMTIHEVRSLCFRELTHGISYNKSTKEPLALYIVNFNHKCPKCQTLAKAFKNIFEPDFPAVVTEKSYTDLFPRERLLYLTPDSKTDLIDYNPNDVYIIGGLVEMGKDVAYTLSAAKKQQIRHARFPIKRIMGLSPTLNVDHAISIMSDFTQTKDWFYSFRWIPARFFKNRLKADDYTSEMEQAYRAQNALSPNNRIFLGPREYRERYAEIMSQADRSKKFRPNPDKYRFHNKVAREERLYGALGIENESY